MLNLGKRYLLPVLGICYLIGLSYLTGCSGVTEKKKTSTDSLAVLKKNTIKINAVTDTILKYKLNRIVKYTSFQIKGKQSIHVLDSLYSTQNLSLILALNRLDSYSMRAGNSIVIPDTLANILSYSPYPFIIDELKEIPKIIFVSRHIQAFACYERGNLVRWGPTCTGRKSKPTPEGLFSTNWKSRQTTSTINEKWILPYYFNILNNDGVAFHHFAMPGYPVSHACIRLLEKDAEWIYYWAEQWILGSDLKTIRAYGTPVVIFDEYKYGKPQPWKALVDNPDTLTISMDEIKILLDKYLPTIKERNDNRQLVRLEIKREKAAKDSLKLSMK
jgi:hypothetical protein